MLTERGAAGARIGVQARGNFDSGADVSEAGVRWLQR
jgi:hypothetical protein